MKRYLRIYRSLLLLSLETLMAYRANFVNSLLSSLAWGIFSFVSILLITSRAPTIYGWRREEILLLTSGYSIVIGFFHTFFSRNFERMAEMINWAQLDSLLVKPVDSQFLISVWWVNYTSIIRIAVGVAFLAYFLHSLPISLTPGVVIAFIVLTFIGLLLLYSVWFIVTTLIMWFPRMSNIVELMYSVSGLSRYPGEMYRNVSPYLYFFLLPFFVVVATPVRFIIQKTSWIEIVELLGLATILFYISRKFWKFALRFYTSASS